MTNTFRTILLAVMLLLGGSQTGYAQDYWKGVEAIKRGDYAAAVREFRPLAEQGNAGAQTNLGYMYSEGLGVLPDSLCPGSFGGFNSVPWKIGFIKMDAFT